MESSDVLTSGNFAKIDKWREDMAYEHTKREDQIY
jgi:tRNA (guanine37-N1)-methyltransferase